MTSALITQLRLAADVARLILLVGDRQYDRFVINDDSGQHVVNLENMLQAAFPDRSAPSLYDPATRTLSTPDQKDRLVERDSLIAELQNNDLPSVLVDAGLLFEDPGHPREGDHALLRSIEHFARSPSARGQVFLRLPHLRAVPQAISSSPAVRMIALPAAARDERMAYAMRRCIKLSERCGMTREETALILANLSDAWRLEELEKLIRTCDRQGIDCATDIEATARAFRLGISDSPWAGKVLSEMVRMAPEKLAQRVRGQMHAVEAVSAALRKAATGLAGAHQSGVSRGPRAVLFFAGPTGTGKTEMAKALAELVFGEDTALIRFDCAEFRQDHTVARLIGAPPGYVGYESGGELTERVRARPHSVLLFDEIEKAHPRLLDLFLSILDDGRLTDGQGTTTRFDEAILIFTSNLGIYEEAEDGRGGITRRPLFTYDTPVGDIIAAVRAAIREEFVTHLGRPELLGRLGGERSLIVFDFLRDLEGVTSKFMQQIITTVERLHGVRLTVDPSVIEAIVAQAATPDALVLGARGLAQVLDVELTTPLADYLCANDVRPAALRAVRDAGRVCIVPG